MFAVKAEKLTKYYGRVKGISQLDLEVEEGEFFGFIGPNGAGKSTTIRTLLGLIKPTGGSASVLGMDVVKDKKSILKEVGYLASEAVFWPGMRAIDVIKMSADLRSKDCTEEAKRIAERLELDLSRRTDELSFGNRKKVAIICALQHEPRLIILDEPTGGLDPLMQREFFNILRERNEKGATVFLSSHVLSEIQRNCTRAAIIREGSVIACGSVSELARTNAKRVNVRGVFPIDSLTGVKDVKRTEDSVSFLYGGGTKELLDALSSGAVSDFTVTEPDLEEIFLHYYGKDGEEA